MFYDWKSSPITIYKAGNFMLLCIKT
jgi:hypothetical protein